MTTRRRLAGVLLSMTLIAGVSRPAHAALFDLYAGLRAGGGWGKGVNTLQTTSADYFNTTAGPGFGAQVGARLLFIDLSLSGTQFVNDKGMTGTYFDALAGIGGSIPLGAARSPADFLRIGAGVGFGVGTSAPVDPPLDNAQIRNKGVLGQATVAWDHYLGRFLSIGLEVNAGYHYFFLGGDAVANTTDNQSQGIHVLGFLTFRAHLVPEREVASDPGAQAESVTPPPVVAAQQPAAQDPAAPPPPDAFAPSTVAPAAPAPATATAP